MRQARSAEGFTLVESLVAMLLLLLGLLAIAPMFILSMKVAESSADVGTVGAVAMEEMETLRGTDYLTLDAGGSLTSDVAGYFLDTTDEFKVRWTVTDSTGAAKYKTLQVRVIAPRQVLGLAKEVTIQSVRAPSR